MGNQDVISILQDHMTKDYVPPHVKVAIQTAIEKITPKKYEKFLPCTCGRNSRSTWFCTDRSEGKYIKLVCNGCGKFAWGKNEADAKRNWNKMIRGETDADSN